MTKKLPITEKFNRKPISRACTFCHQKHLQCDPGRPCKNCVKRGIQDSCHNVERKKAKYLTDLPKAESESAEPESDTSNTSVRPRVSTSLTSGFTHILPNTIDDITKTNIFQYPYGLEQTSYPDQTPATPSSASINSSLLQRSNSLQQRSSSQPHQQKQHQHQQQHLNKITSSSNTESPDVFSSLFANQEYAQLADLLDNNSAHSPSQSSVQNFNVEFQTSFQTDNNTRPYISLSDNSTNAASITVPSHVVEEAPDYTSPLILRHIIKTPEDVYSTSIQPYNYPKAYHALLNYLKIRFKKQQLIQIAETMAEYRPSFIAATRSLVELDLLFAERSFQRSLLEYESMSSLSSSPTIMWRRTGEIVAVSTEFSSLTSHTKTQLLSKRTFIIELMNDKSALDYYRLFSSVAFGDLNGVIITECTLLSPNGEEIKCASTWTVKRDVFDIPMLIVGQFLPILQVR